MRRLGALDKELEHGEGAVDGIALRICGKGRSWGAQGEQLYNMG